MKHPDELARVLEEIEMDLRKGNIDFKQADAGRAAALAVSYRLVPKLDAALAANAEMRAALEHWTHIYSKALSPPGHDTYGEGMRDAKDQVRAILARTNLGRGMVAVPREVVERAQTVVGWYVDNGRGLPHGTRIGEKLLCDLDALLDGGKERG